MSYTFCTIAIGSDYLESTIQFAQKLNEKCNAHHHLIIKQGETPKIDNTTFIELPKDKKLFIHNFFNYNLKYYPIKKAIEFGFEYIFFVDSDWKIEEGFSEDKIVKIMNYMNGGGFDFLFERPHSIGHGKFDKDCFWGHKRDFYKLRDTNYYDEGHVANEQFMVFKNSPKLKTFIEKWEELENIATISNLWAFAEGVEIGMSSAHAKLKWCYHPWQKILTDSFSFVSKDGKFYKRF